MARTRSHSLAKMVAIVAFVYGLLAVFGAFGGAVFIIGMTTSEAGGGPAVVLPVAASATTLLPSTVFPPADVAGELISLGYFNQVEVTGIGLSVGATLAYFSYLLLTPVLHAIVAFGLSSMATRIERNDGFAPQLARTAVVVGVSLIVIGSLTQLLTDYGTSLARFELFEGTDLARWTGPSSFDFTHIAAGVGILLVSVLLRRGRQLERDTEGMV